MPKVQLTRFWRGHEKGAILELSGGVANLLVTRMKAAEYVDPDVQRESDDSPKSRARKRRTSKAE